MSLDTGAPQPVSAERLARAEARVRVRLARNDLSHPMIAALLRAVARREAVDGTEEGLDAAAG